MQYDGSNGWPSGMDMPGSMYSDPRAGGGLDQLGHHTDAASAAAAASHMNHAMHNHYAAIAAAAAANNHAAANSNSIANNVMGGSQIPDALKRDKDAIYG